MSQGSLFRGLAESAGPLFGGAAPVALPPLPKATHRLRPYQLEALEGIADKLRDHRSTLLVLPTGCGKTTVFAKAIEGYVTEHRTRALMVAHREELIDQGARRLYLDTGLRQDEIGVEMANRRSVSTNRVVVASVQSLHAKRLATFSPDEFGMLVVDEAHHATATTYRAVLDYFPWAKVLGVTATPDRGDGDGLGKVFESVAYVYEIRDAIEQGYLVPLRCLMVQVDGMDLSKVRTTAGDLNEGDVGKIVEQEGVLHAVVKPTLDQAGDRQALVFAVRVSHAQALAEMFNRYEPGSTAAVWADCPDRAQVLERYSRGELKRVCNVGILTEGYDNPATSCIVMARPTKSRALYAQCIGRGTRLLGATYTESVSRGKRDVLILDYVGNSGRHKLVCALDILDSAEDAEVREVAERKVKEKGMLVDEALAEAEAEVVAARQHKLRLEVKYRAIEVVDQFTLLGIAPRAGRWGGAALTGRQLEALRNAGVVKPERLDKGQASEMMDAIIRRREHGLCTLKQAKILMRAGLNAEISFDRAHNVIDVLARNGWKATPELIAAPDLQVQR